MCIYIYKDSVGALTFLALQDQGFQIKRKIRNRNFNAKKFTPPGQSSKPELPGQSVK